MRGEVSLYPPLPCDFVEFRGTGSFIRYHILFGDDLDGYSTVVVVVARDREHTCECLLLYATVETGNAGKKHTTRPLQ